MHKNRRLRPSASKTDAPSFGCDDDMCDCGMHPDDYEPVDEPPKPKYMTAPEELSPEEVYEIMKDRSVLRIDKIIYLRDAPMSSEQINRLWPTLTDVMLQSAIAARSELSEDHLSGALAHSEDEIVYGAARNPNVTVEQLESLIRHSYWCVRMCVATHPNSTTDMLDVLQQDRDPSVRAMVASHPNVTDEQIAEALQDKHPEPRMIALRHESVTDKQLETVSDDDTQYYEVRDTAAFLLSKKGSTRPAADYGILIGMRNTNFCPGTSSASCRSGRGGGPARLAPWGAHLWDLQPALRDKDRIHIAGRFSSARRSVAPIISSRCCGLLQGAKNASRGRTQRKNAPRCQVIRPLRTTAQRTSGGKHPAGAGDGPPGCVAPKQLETASPMA